VKKKEGNSAVRISSQTRYRMNANTGDCPRHKRRLLSPPNWEQHGLSTCVSAPWLMIKTEARRLERSAVLPDWPAGRVKTRIEEVNGVSLLHKRQASTESRDTARSFGLRTMTHALHSLKTRDSTPNRRTNATSHAIPLRSTLRRG
jgi:hypothetical protein